MREALFETRAIYAWHILILVLLSPIMTIIVYAGVIGAPRWLLGMVSWGFLFFLFLFSIIFSKVKVYEDGIMFRMRYISFDEVGGVRFRWGGRVLVLGRWLDWFILLNPKEFVEAIKAVKPEILVEYRKPVRRWKPIVYSLIPLVPIAMLAVIGYVLSYAGVVIDPFIWALVWGTVATLVTTAWAYWLPPRRYRTLGLGRLGTSITIGLAIGIPVFLIMLTRVSMQVS